MEGILRVILLEAALERVPRELWSHPQVVKSARRYGVRPGDMLLEKSLHYNAMAALPQKWKRGRPDIVHVALLSLLDSPLARDGLLEVYVHVYDGRVFRVDPGTRIPKSYERFRGLMAQLLEYGRVPLEGDALIYMTHERLGDFVNEYGKLLLLWEHGEDRSPEWIVARSLYAGMPLGIGAFARGDFKRSTLRKSAERYRIMSGFGLKAWSVASRLVCAAERLLGYL